MYVLALLSLGFTRSTYRENEARNADTMPTLSICGAPSKDAPTPTAGEKSL